MKKLAILLCVGLALTSCAKSNPLINPKVIHYFTQQSYFNEDGTFPITICGHYFAGYSKNLTTKMQAKCDHFAKGELEYLTDAQDYQGTATLKDFKDPALWQAVYPKEGGHGTA